MSELSLVVVFFLEGWKGPVLDEVLLKVELLQETGPPPPGAAQPCTAKPV